MSKWTTLILLLVVAGLGAVALQQAEKEQRQSEAEKVIRLFDGVDMEALSAIRLEHIRGSRHIRMRRDGALWFLTDPMAWPVEAEIIGKFVDVIQRNGAEPVSERLAEDVRESFEPPLGFIEAISTDELGETKALRVEVGQLDIDGLRIFVRVNGRVMRTIRNIESLFDFTVQEYRSKRLFSFTRGEVAEVERVGGWEHELGTQPLGLGARGYGERWELTAPVRGAGDPVIFQAWTSYLTSMRAKRFASDLPDPDLARYGLDQPWVTLRITNLRGLVQSLHVVEKDGRVYARRDERNTIYELDSSTVPFICEPETNFVELRFSRIARSQVSAVQAEYEGGALRLTRGADGWTVAARLTKDSWGTEYAADETVVGDLLASTEELEVSKSFLDREVVDFFPEGASTTRFWVEGFGNQRFGGTFGEDVTLPDGATVVPFARFESGIPQAVAPEFAARTRRPLEEYLSRSLWTQTNTWLRTLTLRSGDRERQFERGDTFDWRDGSTEKPARVLDPVLEQLLFLKVEEHLPPGADQLVLADEVVVTFDDSEHRSSEARIGRLGDQVLVQVGELRGRLRPQSLHAALLELLEPR